MIKYAAIAATIITAKTKKMRIKAMSDIFYSCSEIYQFSVSGFYAK
jgi:hypothetical protein